MPIAPHPVDQVRYMNAKTWTKHVDFPVIAESRRHQRLRHPSHPVHIVLDTDAKNEIDDQFAIVYALLSQEIVVEAIHAAPFTKRDYPTPAKGMEASYDEILTLFDHMTDPPRIPVLKGSEATLSTAQTPIKSDAGVNLIKLAKMERTTPLYVVAIGAITNVISAILLDPHIIERIVVVWLGAHPTYWNWNLGATADSRNQYSPMREFNFRNDPAGAIALFDSGVPLVWVPCKNVAEHLRTVPAEIDRYVASCGDIGRYLATIFNDWVTGPAASKSLWDMSTIAYLVNSMWVPTVMAPTPRFNQGTVRDCSSNPFDEIDPNRHSCRVAIDVKRDPIFSDFFAKLASYT